MFKPTQPLLKRTEKRLKGWRAPAVKALRRELKITDPLVLDPPFLNVLHDEPRRGLPAAEAYEQMGLPMQEIFDLRGGSRRPVQKGDLLLDQRLRGLEPEPVEELELGIARTAQKSRPRNTPYRRRVGLADMNAVPKVNPMRYKPPATNYWRHSIYAYNKETMRNLPATTVNANKLIRAYFNMTPREQHAENILSGQTAADAAAIKSASESAASSPMPDLDAESTEGSAEAKGGPMSAEQHKVAQQRVERENQRRLKDHKTTEGRIYVSDRGYPNHGQLRVDVLGKISPRMQSKGNFHIPYRAVEAVAPQITYKHWKGGIGVSVHVHEGEPYRGRSAE